MTSRFATILAVVVVVALLARVVLAVVAPHEPLTRDGDPHYYDRVAVSVAAGDPRPTALHPPAWPYLLGATYALAGPDSEHARQITATLLNAVLGAAAVLLIGLIALELWGPRVGLVAAGLAAVYPAPAILGVTLFSEPLFVALELAALLAVLRHRGSPHRWRWLVAAGVLTGLATLTRANGAALLLPFALAVGLPDRKLAAPAVLVAVTALTILPWTVRNAVVLDSPVPVSTNLGKTLAGTYNEVAHGHKFRWITGRLLPARYRPALRKPTEAARSAALTRLALEYVADHPLDVPRAMTWNTVRMAELDPVGRSIYTAALGSPTLARVSFAGFAVLVALAIAGALTRHARRAPAFFWLVPAVMWLSAAVMAGHFSRFRAPLDPFLVLLAALALTEWPARARRRAAGRRTARRHSPRSARSAAGS